MNAIQTLSVRTAAAATRLAELEQKRERAGGDTARVTAVAVRELQAAIEELQVAIEQLNEMSDGVAASRVDAQKAETRYEELREALPTASLFTDDAGVVLGANSAAGDLFNLSSRHLRGKPMMLFVADRDALARLLRTAQPERGPVMTELTIRPRDRKPRRLAVQVQHLTAHNCRCWFFLQAAEGTQAVEPAVSRDVKPLE
jgi:PAS domain S-box-containing protein